MHAIEIRLEAATSAQIGYYGPDAIHDGDSGLRVRGRQQLGAIGENRLSGEKGKEKIDRCADAGEGIPLAKTKVPGDAHMATSSWSEMICVMSRGT